MRKEFKIQGKNYNTGAQSATIIVERREDGIIYASENSLHTSILEKVLGEVQYYACTVRWGGDWSDILKVFADGTVEHWRESQDSDHSWSEKKLIKKENL